MCTCELSFTSSFYYSMFLILTKIFNRVIILVICMFLIPKSVCSKKGYNTFEFLILSKYSWTLLSNQRIGVKFVFSEFVSCLPSVGNDSCSTISEGGWSPAGTFSWISESSRSWNRRGSESSALRQNSSSVQFSGSVPTISFLSRSLGLGSASRRQMQTGFRSDDTSSWSPGSRRNSDFQPQGGSLYSFGSESTSTSTNNLNGSSKVENRQEMECRQVFFDCAL